MQRQEEKGEAAPSARPPRKTGTAGTRAVTLKTRIPAGKITTSSKRWPGSSRSRCREIAKVPTTRKAPRLGAAATQEGPLESVGLYGKHQTDNGYCKYKNRERVMNHTCKNVKEFVPGCRSCRLCCADPHEKPDHDQYQDRDPDRHMDCQIGLRDAKSPAFLEQRSKYEQAQI